MNRFTMVALLILSLGLLAAQEAVPVRDLHATTWRQYTWIEGHSTSYSISDNYWHFWVEKDARNGQTHLHYTIDVWKDNELYSTREYGTCIVNPKYIDMVSKIIDFKTNEIKPSYIMNFWDLSRQTDYPSRYYVEEIDDNVIILKSYGTHSYMLAREPYCYYDY